MTDTLVITKIRQWRTDGVSYRECGGRLGLSKGQVAGICSREGICQPLANGANERRLAFRAARKSGEPLPAKKAKAKKPKKAKESKPPRVAKMKLLIVSDVEGCRYPIGEPKKPGFHYCGAPRAYPDYCAYHQRLCYREPGPRERG